VRASHLAPDAPDAGAVALGLGLVYVGDPLAAVPRHILLGADALDLQQRRVLVLVRLGPLVAQDRAPHVHPAQNQNGIESDASPAGGRENGGFGVNAAYLTRWPWRPFTIVAAAAGGLADEGWRGWGEGK
jgi:hypothetical protein